MPAGPFTNQFMIACALIGLALLFSLMGAVILALPLGLAGGILLISDMWKHINQ